MIAGAHDNQATRKSARLALGAVVMTWGIQAIVTQTLLLREALVLMFGSELAWGIVLFAWLLGVAIGAVIGGWLADRLREADLVLAIVLLALGAVGCLDLWALRGARAWLGIEPGELLPLPETALAAMCFVPPAGALVGLAFPLACAVVETDRRTGLLGRIYALESVGSLIGGAAFSFWAVEHLNPVEIVMVCGALTAGALAWLLAVTRPRLYATIGLAAVSLGALLLAIGAGDALGHQLVERRWKNIAPGYELYAESESRYQNLCVGRRANQFTLYCDGKVSADFPDPYTFVPLAHFWMCVHPDPRHVLVLGGGAEGLLAEILRHPVEHVDYVEPDPRQIELIEPFLAPTDRAALADERVTVHHVDARYFVKTRRNQFDLVIARLPEPVSAQRARFYTDEFFGEVSRAMAPGGALCMTVSAAPADLPTASATYVASVRATLRPHFAEVLVGWGDPAHVLAASQTGALSTDPKELSQRYTQRGVECDMFHPAWFDGATDWFDPEKLRARTEQLDAVKNAETSTDLRPAIYLQRLALWESLTGGGGKRATHVVERLRSVKLPELLVVLGVIAVIVVVAQRIRARSPAGWAGGAVVLSVATTGFASMALSIVWLFAFQNLYGYVYQRIGWIIAVFMGGLVMGCSVVSARTKCIEPADHLRSYLRRRLIAVDVFLAVLALGVPAVLPALGSLQSTELALILVEWAVLVLVAITGVLGGASFALAGGLRLATTGRVGVAAGSVNSADHAGACAGALLTGILLVPVFGTVVAAIVLAGMKLATAVLLAVTGRLSR